MSPESKDALWARFFGTLVAGPEIRAKSMVIQQKTSSATAQLHHHRDTTFVLEWGRHRVDQ